MVDFARINHMQRVLGSIGFSRHFDFVSFNGAKVDVESSIKLFTLPPRWYSAAVAIIELPVAVWNSPPDVSGEFYTEDDMALGAGKKAPAAAKAAPAEAAPIDSHSDAVMDKLSEIESFLGAVDSKLDALTDMVSKLGGATPIPTKAAAAAAVPAARTKNAAAAEAGAPAATAEPATAKAAASTAAAGSYTAEDLAGLNRKQLSDIAPEFGINPQMQKADDLRTQILQAQGGSAKPAATKPAATQPAAAKSNVIDISTKKAKHLMKILEVEENYAVFAEQLDPDSEAEDALRCGGDCLRCPNPEKHPTPADQINACFESIHTALGLDQPAL